MLGDIAGENRTKDEEKQRETERSSRVPGDESSRGDREAEEMRVKVKVNRYVKCVKNGIINKRRPLLPPKSIQTLDAWSVESLLHGKENG